MGIFNIFKKKKVKEEPQVVKEKPVVEEPQTEQDIYNVKVHAEKGWQVIKEGGLKAIKRFNTQAEAIEYAKELVGNDANKKYVVYKKDGTIK